MTVRHESAFGLGPHAWATVLLVAFFPPGAGATVASDSEVNTSLAEAQSIIAMNEVAPRAGAGQISAEGESAVGAQLDEIVVTARKRAENLQDTPISIAAFTSAALESRGIVRAEELASITPNLVYQENPGGGGSASNAAVFIRGVGQSDFIPTVDPGVGLYVDGVYIARSVGALLDLVDVDRIEVLRGPQGTLFGRNTIGGAVSVSTIKPQFQFSAKASATAGSDRRHEVKAWVNVPLTRTMAATMSVASIQQDGYVSQPAAGEDLGDRGRLVGRVALRWQSDEVELNVAADGTRIRENGAPFVLRGVNFASNAFNPQGLPLLPPGSAPRPGFYVINPPADVPVDNFSLFNNYIATLVAQAGNCLGLGAPVYSPAADQSNPACYGPQYVAASSRRNLGTFPSRSDDDLWGVQASLDWQLADQLNLKSISAYRHLHSDFQRDGDASPLTIFHLADELSQRQFSQELQLQGRSLHDSLKWIVGLYYFNERAINPNIVDFAAIKALSGGTSETRSLAEFAQATYSIATQWDVTAGLRYTRDRKSFLPDQRVLDNKGGPFPIGLPLLPPITVDGTFSKLTPMLNLAYKPSGTSMLYATYSEGFKSGGFTQRVFPPLPATPSFQPEKVRSYEIGTKTTWLANRLRLNLAAYYTDYKDIQVQIFRAIAPITDNGGRARVKGFEFESEFAPVAGWLLQANVGLTDAAYTEIAPGATELSRRSSFAFVSKWSGSLTLQKEFRLPASGTVVPRLDWSARSRYFNDALNTAAIEQPGYGLFDGAVSWTSPRQTYSASAGVHNMLDRQYILGGYFTPGSGVEVVMPARGREWFATLRTQF